MQLKELLKDMQYECKGVINDINIDYLSHNSEDIKENSLFFCLVGENADGHNFSQSAIQKGALAIVVEHFVDTTIPQICVKNTRLAMSYISARFFGNPEKKLKILGITGTNGKTTTSYIIRSILHSAGYKVGVIGTLGVCVGDEIYDNDMTTPDPIRLYSIFRQMVDSYIEYVVMEVSAHAIFLDKVAGINFEIGILTNITQDHLDFFKTFSKYAQTKLNFISSQYCKKAIVNIDDKLCKQLFLEYAGSTYECRGVSIEDNSDVYVANYSLNNDSLEFKICGIGDTFYCKSGLIGKFNLYNCLEAVTCCLLLGIAPRDIMIGLTKMSPVKGRFNVVRLKNNANVVIDYAHTPDGLLKILTSVRDICKGKIISVFGCGGNRDRLKRPIMGEISAKYADYTIVTSDNPRFESPIDIASDILKGLKSKTEAYECILDRTQAINRAVELADNGDVVVISGKGAEDYLDIKGQKMHYSDYEVIENINKI